MIKEIKGLATKRLIIKSTKKEDTDFCLDIWLDDEMGKYLSDPPRDKAGEAYLKWKETVEDYDGCYYFIAVSKDTGDYIGTCSAVPSDDKIHWDLGYAIHKKYWVTTISTIYPEKIVAGKPLEACGELRYRGIDINELVT